MKSFPALFHVLYKPASKLTYEYQPTFSLATQLRVQLRDMSRFGSHLLSCMFSHILQVVGSGAGNSWLFRFVSGFVMGEGGVGRGREGETRGKGVRKDRSRTSLRRRVV